MPRLSTFSGVVIYVYIVDHGVAHVHTLCGDDRAVVGVATGGLLAGTVTQLLGPPLDYLLTSPPGSSAASLRTLLCAAVDQSLH